MPDNLTSRLKKELDERGINASLSVIEDVVRRKGYDPTSSPYARPQARKEADLWKALETGKFPDWYQAPEEHPEGGMLNALGVGLWQGIDTYALGIPNYLLKAGGVDVEDYLDYEDPGAKWAGAIGGFAGFVAGAPMKIIGKGAQKLGMAAIGSPMLKKSGKETADSVIRLANEKGAKLGIERSIRKDTLKGYRNIVKEAQINENMRGPAFRDKVARYLDGVIKSNPELTREQAAAITRMFGETNLYRRPIQDFIGVAIQRGGNNRFNRWLGHAANDVLMFSAIDTVMESVRYMGENTTGEGGYDFNFTAPMWGAVNGVAFSTLGWLSPAGKAATWKKDFMGGLRGAFSRNPYKNKTSEQMVATGNFWGNQLKRMGESTEVTIKDKQFDLTSRMLGTQLESKFGADGIKHLTNHLQTERRKWGKAMMKWSTTQEAASLGQVWKRMIMGGLLFNTHSFYDMYASDADVDIVNDILPHFLIGAYVQRRANPAKFDLNHPQMNQLRQNLTMLGVSPRSLSAVPTFKGKRSRTENIFNDAKYKPIEELMREEGLITDNFEVSESGLNAGEKSVVLEDNPIFKILHDNAEGRDGFVKPMEDISTTQANRIVARALEIEPKLKNPRDRARILGESILESTADFEGEFTKIIDFMAEAEIPGITTEIIKDGVREVRVPNHIDIIELKGPAERGELEWLRTESGEVLEGPEAVKELERFSESVNSVLQTARLVGAAKVSTETGDLGFDMNNHEFAGKAYERIRQSEIDIDSRYPDKSITAKAFRFGEEYYDYVQVIAHNHSIRVAENSVGLFKETNTDKDTLKSKLREAGILFSPEGIGPYRIIDDVSKLGIVSREKADKLEEDRIADARRFLGRVLTLQSIVGSDIYKGHELSRADKNPVDIESIDSLKSYLKKNGLDLADMNEYMATQIIDYALRDKIRGTDLGINQVEALFNLIEYDGMARFETRTKGRAGGFRVFTLNESVAPDSTSETFRLIKNYNKFIHKVVEDSNGLVTIVNERSATDKNFLLSLDQVVPSKTSPSGEGREVLTNFLMALSASKHNLTSFTHQMELFMNADPRNANRLISWLVNTKVLKPSKKLKYDEPNIDLLVKELKGQQQKVFEFISDKMSFYGYTPNYAKRLYEQYEQTARDKLWEDPDESDYTAGMSIQGFFSKYRIEGVNEKPRSMEENSESFDALVFSNKDDFVLNNNIINKVIEKTRVRVGNRFYKIDTISEKYRDARKEELIRDITGLLVQKMGQRRVNVIKWIDGRVLEDSDIIQQSPFHTYLNNTLQLNYSIVDTRASVYEVSRDGRYVKKIELNIFGDTNNLSEEHRAHIKAAKTDFERVLNQAIKIDGMNTVGPDGEAGIHMMRVFSHMEPIAIEVTNLKNIEAPFIEFASRTSAMTGDAGVKKTVRDRINSLSDKFQSGKVVTSTDYNMALKWLVSEQMFTGTDGTGTFVDYLNNKGDIQQKMQSRIKLFNTKKFVKPNVKWVGAVASAYRNIGRTDVSKALGKVLKKRGLDLAVWDDVSNANLRSEVEQIVKDMKLDGLWNNYDNIGNAHNDVTAYDSIAFVSRDTMTYAHTVIGHNPYSFTPIKPVITSGGANAPLILGKTLLVYNEGFDSFFSRNNLNMLVTKTGAKIINDPGGVTTVNTTFDGLKTANVGGGQIRRIPLEALGLKADKDYYSNTAKTSQADWNYTTNREATEIYNDVYSSHVENAISNISRIMEDPISVRKWLLTESGQDGRLINAVAESQGMEHFNNAVFFASLSRDADPMSYSPNIVRNKMYNMYVNSIINEMRSVSNPRDKEGLDTRERYGGQAILIQTQHRLKPTLVDKEGDMLMRGEVMIPYEDYHLPVKSLGQKGIEVRFVYSGVKMESQSQREFIKGEIVFGKDNWNRILQNVGSGDLTLGGLHELTLAAAESSGMKGLTLGIAVRRNPRTRPNDLAVLGLKGFLEESYGNSLQINSFDVANVYEGDYDVDKADYWTSNRDSFYDHVARASQHYVQGVDPKSLMTERKLNFDMTPTDYVDRVNTIAADADLFKSSIGIVQKIPRKLGFVEKIGGRLEENNPMVKNFNENYPNAPIDDGKVLLGGNKGQDWSILIDYNSNDFFTRSALETQYIIDGKGKINSEISRDIHSWADDFLFPKMADSYAPGEAKKEGNSLLTDMRTKGASKGRRVRVFRKVIFNKNSKQYEEVNLSKLDVAMIKEMLSEYGKFLNVTGDSFYENTGAKRKSSFEDVYDASESFFLFNQDLNNSLYYRLRNKYIDRDNPGKGRWRDEGTPEGEQFKNLFGVVSDTYKKDGKDVKYWKPLGQTIGQDAGIRPVNDNAISNGEQFFYGERGAPVDRILAKVYQADPFNRRGLKGRYRAATGEIPGMVNSWYNEIMGGATSGDITRATDLLADNVTKAVFDYNKKVSLIGSLKYKIVQISNNNNVPYKTRKESIEKVNKLIRKVEGEIAHSINKKYWKTRSSKDLQKMTFVSVDGEQGKDNIKQGTIYYNTMNSIRESLPFIGGDANFGLNSDGVRLYSQLNGIRKLFYGNRTRLGDVLKYGDKTILTSDKMELLKNFDSDLSTISEIENRLLLQGVNQHGIRFIFKFMTPAIDKYSIGVFDGAPMPIPFKATEKYDPGSRYRRGIKFLTGVASGTIETEGIPGLRESSAQMLRYIQTTEAQWQRYFNRKIDMRKMFDDAAISAEEAHTLFRYLKIPDFNDNFKKLYTRYDGLRWNKDKDRIGHGRSVMNNSLMDMYMSIMGASGKAKEFETYLTEMNTVQERMIAGEIIDPLEYLSIRSKMDSDVIKIAKTVFTGGWMNDGGNNKFVKEIKNNPIYALMGGESYFKGLSLETQPKRSINRLRDIRNMSVNSENIKNRAKLDSKSHEQKLDDLIANCLV